MIPLVLTFVGDDRPGLVNAISETIAARGGAWLDIRRPLSRLCRHPLDRSLVVPLRLGQSVAEETRLAARAAFAEPGRSEIRLSTSLTALMNALAAGDMARPRLAMKP